MAFARPVDLQAALAAACARLPGRPTPPDLVPLERADPVGAARRSVSPRRGSSTSTSTATAPQPDWVSALPLRLARGDRDAAAELAQRLAGELGERAIAIGGLLAIQLRDDDLAAAVTGLGELTDPPTGMAAVTAQPRIRERSVTDPLYASALLHARLVRGGDPTRLGGWPPVADVGVRAPWTATQRAVIVDASAVPLALSRTQRDGSTHHLLAALARLATDGLAWFDLADADDARSQADHQVAVAARRALALGWCGLGLTPPERF